MILLVMGLPGSGKTTLAKEILDRTDFIHLNADDVRADLNSDLGFSKEDRIEQARRMGAMARLLNNQGFSVIADFICPTKETRLAFGKADYTVWVSRINESEYPDTNTIWEDPTIYDLKINSGLSPEVEASLVIGAAKIYDWKKPTTLLLGRYQPWHDGHSALKKEAHLRTEQVVIGVRNTHNTSEKDPYDFNQVSSFIKEKEENSFVVKFPNITNILYGRDVGHTIEKVNLDSSIESISATAIRNSIKEKS